MKEYLGTFGFSKFLATIADGFDDAKTLSELQFLVERIKVQGKALEVVVLGHQDQTLR